ncbi:MAG: hypothetical protein PVJ43_01330, partial [Gemmatimonadales bacterium]
MKLSGLTAAVGLFFAFAVPSLGQAQSDHAFNVHDLIAMDRISDPQVSPDGDWVTFVVSELDREANRRRTDIWLMRSDGADLRRFTTHEASDFSPRWSPTGRTVWFLSTRSGSSQVWYKRVDGGEAQQVTDLPLGVGNLVVAADGRQIAFTAD